MEERLKDTSRSVLAALFLNRFDGAELAQRRVASFFGRHPLRDVLLDLLFKMEAHFIVKILLGSFFVE